MTKQELVKDIRDFCLMHANQENVEKSARYFKDGYNGYGLTSQQIKEKSNKLVKHEGVHLRLIMEAMPLLMANKSMEETSFGLLIVNALHREFTRETFNSIGDWFSMGISNWAHADTLGSWILPRMMEKKFITMNDFVSWLSSPYTFQRRCVPVTLIKSLKTAGRYTEIFEFLEPLMTDPAREVHQGMGWFLREAWKKKPDETEIFLMKWKDISPRLIFQYACEKMEPEHKQLFKRQKN